MSGIPRQVEEAATLAEQLHARMFNPDENEEGEDNVETEAATSDTSEQPASNEAQEEEAPQQVQPEKEDELSFRERYLTLKGKYEAEVPRLNNELKEFKRLVFERLGDVAQKQVAPEVKAEEVDPEWEKFREEWGDEQVAFFEKLTERRVKKAVEAALSEKLMPVQEKMQSVEEVQIKTAQENFMRYLDGQVKGDWRQLYTSQEPSWLEFLGRPDPSGIYTYGQLVEAFDKNWDADRLAAVFNLYLNEMAPPQVQPQVSAPDPAKAAAKDAMVAPRRSTQHVAPAAEDKKVWTQAMIREFQQQDRAGAFDKETSDAMWTDLLSALRENRIRP